MINTNIQFFSSSENSEDFQIYFKTYKGILEKEIQLSLNEIYKTNPNYKYNIIFDIILKELNEKKIILTKQKEEHNNEEIQQIYIKYKEEKSIMTKMRSLSRKKHL